MGSDMGFILIKFSLFFFQTCRLGRHAPVTKVLRDGILKVGKKQAEKLANEDTEQWFDLIGDSPTASLVKLYSQVRQDRKKQLQGLS
jgi:mediator of RNA polymerase II transcription subunit 13